MGKKIDIATGLPVGVIIHDDKIEVFVDLAEVLDRPTYIHVDDVEVEDFDDETLAQAQAAVERFSGWVSVTLPLPRA